MIPIACSEKSRIISIKLISKLILDLVGKPQQQQLHHALSSGQVLRILESL